MEVAMNFEFRISDFQSQAGNEAQAKRVPRARVPDGDKVQGRKPNVLTESTSGITPL